MTAGGVLTITRTITEPLPNYAQMFEDFYRVYPRKMGKQDAKKAFRKALDIVDFDTLLAGALRYANDPNLPSDKQFLPYPATWLNRGSWDDEALPERKLSLEELAIRNKALAEKRHLQALAATKEIMEQDKWAKENADAPKCEHGKIIAACMPCIRAGKV